MKIKKKLWNTKKGIIVKSIIFGVLCFGGAIALGFLDYRIGENSIFYGVDTAGKIQANITLPRISSSKPQYTIFFTGDIMLDRGVEYQMKKHNWLYPFSRIKALLNQADIAIGNLEGPIVSSPPNFPDDSFRFAFSPNVLQGLSLANFKILSLANNHTDNMGEKGWQETREYLRKAGIGSIGHPIRCDRDNSIIKKSFVFLAFNKTFPINCSDKKIVKIVQTARYYYPDKFIVVILHWGNEYHLESSILQKTLAHQIIQAGANLIIGSHPHVVEEIEEYHNRLIFYSLGNFIFDQYFSKDTQEGLVVKLNLYPQKVVYQLFPTQGHLSQPFLMSSKDKKKFLDNLAKRSDACLRNQIQKGEIKISRSANLSDKKSDKAQIHLGK